ncbi:maternal protein tudor isoform X2 [Phlebotomus papatasi]|uniref:maternal protein tudor isoform X2 n=1 Tax=Phlebotomus papatasi TaxID=29031 RepID=UPI0024835AF9|nr:maternal protein tudor isoform X2 [Phlebotomus papatasi]
MSLLMFITHVDAGYGGNFLRIFGQVNQTEAMNIEKIIEEVVKNHAKIFRPEEIQEGVRCLTMYEDGQYYRAKIIRVLDRDLVAVYFIDYGNTATVNIRKLLSLHTKSQHTTYLMGTPPQANEYILARISGPWSQEQIESIREDLCNYSLSYHAEDKVDRIPIIGILYKNFDYSQYLIERREFGVFISVKNQKESFLAGKLVTSPPPATGKAIPEKIEKLANMRYLQPSTLVKKSLEPKPSLNPFLSPQNSAVNLSVSGQQGKLPDMLSPGVQGSPGEKIMKHPVLPVHSFYEVTCSHIEDGYRLFSVQLKQKDTELRKLMNDLAQTPLQQLQHQPKIGMVCIARYEKTNKLYRTVITDIEPNACVVNFVDFGHKDTIACGNLFEIPAHLMRSKMFSVKSTLYKSEELGDKYVLKEYFQQLIMGKDLSMKVMPNQGQSFVQCCELYINSINIMDELKHIQMFGLQYQPTVRLSADFQGPVIVRYVDSPKKFYVQLIVNIPDHDSLMDKLSINCHRKGKQLTDIKPGNLCAVSIDNDVDWYRGKVVELKPMEKKVSVHLVDYGKIIDVPTTSLREIGYQFTQMPPQVYECCIKGFENIHDITDSSANAFEMLVEDAKGERKTLKMHIVDFLTEETLLVNLFDESVMPPVNISKSLCRSQMPYKDYVNMFEKKTSNTFRKRESFGRNEVVGEIPNDHHHQTGNFTTSSDIDTYQKPEEKNSWDNGNVTPERAFEGENGKQGDRRQKNGEKWNANDKKNNNYSEKPKRQFSDNPKGFERRDNQTRGDRGDRGGDRGSDRNDRGYDRGNDRGYDRNDRGFDRGNDRNDRGFDRANDRTDRGGGGGGGERERGPRKNFKGATKEGGGGRPYQANNHAETTDKDYNVSTAHELKTVDSISLSSTDFRAIDVTFNADIDVILIYWMDPEEFYVQLKAHFTEYEAMMREIQDFYPGKRPIGGTRYENGWCVIARNSRDEMLYRAKVCDYNKKLNKYKVLFVDRGYRGVVTPDLMWPMTEKFMKLPSMAIKCSLAYNVVLDFERQDIFPHIGNYVNDTMAITCKFHEVQDNVHLVKMNVDKGDLLEALVKDGLVKRPKDEPTPIFGESTEVNVKLLPGQTIRVMVTNVENLGKFDVVLEHSNIKLTATFYDIHYAKVIGEDLVEQLKKFDGTYCKVKVVGLGPNDVLRLKILSKAFLEDPPLICRQVIFQSDFSVLVAFVESLNVVYVQNSEFTEVLTQLINEMYSHYESDHTTCTAVTPRKVYAVKSVVDDNWYRGEVVSVSGQEVTVKYVDYGNTEVVRFECLRNLTGYFGQASSYAVKVFLPMELMEAEGEGKEEKEALEEKVVSEFGKMIVNLVPQMKVLRKYKGEWIVDLCVNGCSVAEELEKKGLARAADEDIVCRLIDGQENSDELEGEKNGVLVYVTHIVNPHEFYVQLEADTEAIDQLQESIQIVGESMPQLMDVKVGDLCLAKYSMDGNWYRAKILDSTEDITSVQFLDYGNMDVITDGTLIREISDAFEKFIPYARRLALPLIPKDHQDEWRHEAIEAMQKLYQDQPARYTVISQADDLAYVHLITEEGTSAEEMLLKMSLAEPLSIIEPHSVGFVSHINSLTDFYMQLERDTADLEFISYSLSELGAKEGSAEENVEEGKMYAALFDEDNSWYRAKLIHSAAAGELEVIFVDYGNTAITNSVKYLPDKIAELPILSRKCSLKLPESGKWSEEAEKKFVELAQEGATCFNIVPLAPGQTTLVRLLLDGKDVMEILSQEEEHQENVPADSPKIPEEKIIFAQVSHINSPGDFYLHLSTRSDILDKVLNHLENPPMDPVTERRMDKICAATFSADGCVYRAKIEGTEDDKFKVFFIDYGNTTVTSDLWELSQEFQAIEPLAMRCALEKKTPGNWTKDHLEKFLELSKGGEENFQVIFVDRSSTPVLVKLLLNGQEISLESPEESWQTLESQISSLTEEMVNASMVRRDAEAIASEICDLSITQCEDELNAIIHPAHSTQLSDIPEDPSAIVNKIEGDSGTSTQSHTSGEEISSNGIPDK